MRQLSRNTAFETVVSVDSVIAGRHVPLMCPPDGFGKASGSRVE